VCWNSTGSITMFNSVPGYSYISNQTFCEWRYYDSYGGYVPVSNPGQNPYGSGSGSNSGSSGNSGTNNSQDNGCNIGYGSINCTVRVQFICSELEAQQVTDAVNPSSTDRQYYVDVIANGGKATWGLSYENNQWQARQISENCGTPP
jgi:hypothetical protein